MAAAYIYMECPLKGETVTLGRLKIERGVGSFQYSPEAIKERFWVPDPIRYPLRDAPFIVKKNGGVPGFIDDAMPDGWGERVLRRVEKGPLDRVMVLLKSNNSDRAGNLMSGMARLAPDGLGGRRQADLKAQGLDDFIDACAAIYDNSVDDETLAALKIRDQRSSAGGARPKRTFQGDEKLILAKPTDRYDHYDLPSIEYACMTFAGLKGLNVAKTALFKSSKGNTLLVDRFDRVYCAENKRFKRIPMLSGLTLLDAEWDAQGHQHWDYAILADELYRRGAPEADRRELYKRMAYNALAGNADDHPRNHAIIWVGGGWRLSPMYDVLPILDEGPAKALAMAVGIEGRQLSRANLLSQHQHFALSRVEAEAILDEVISWESELREHYSQFLTGRDLDEAVTASSGMRLKS